MISFLGNYHGMGQVHENLIQNESDTEIDA